MVVLLAGCLLLAACSGGGTGSDTSNTMQVCLATDINGMAAHSMNVLAAQGVQQQPVGLHVQVAHSASDYLSNLQRCVGYHPALVLAVSPDMATAVWRAAQLHQNQRFALIDATPVDDNGQSVELSNVADLLFNEQEPGYLVGTLAGLLEVNKLGSASHNTLGVLGLNHGPSVDPYIAGYVAGARSVDQNVTIKLQYSDSQDASFCKQLGINQIAAGADILFEVTGRCATGYIDAAYDAGSYAIGSDIDMAYASPAVISSAVKHVDHVVSLFIQRLRAGDFRSGKQVFTLHDDATGFSTPSSVVPQAIINQVIDVRTKIHNGEITPPDTIPPGL